MSRVDSYSCSWNTWIPVETTCEDNQDAHDVHDDEQSAHDAQSDALLAHLQVQHDLIHTQIHRLFTQIGEIEFHPLTHGHAQQIS